MRSPLIVAKESTKIALCSNASPIALVGTIQTPQKTQRLVGIVCLSNGPSTTFNYDPSGEYKTWTRSEKTGRFPAIQDWEKWAKATFETREDFGVWPFAVHELGFDE